MREILRRIVGYILATGGFALIAGGASWTGYRLRDGLLVATLGALLAAMPNHNAAPPARPTRRRTWPQLARTLTLTGTICGVAAAGLAVWLDPTGWGATARNALWVVGLLLLIVGLFWPGRTVIYPAPAYRWSLDAAGRLVRLALGRDAAPGTTTHPALHLGRVTALLVLVVLAVGVWLRLEGLTARPSLCIGAECDATYALVEGDLADGPVLGAGLYANGARLLLPWLGDGLAALRGSAALLGLLLLPAWLWAARPWLRAPGLLAGALVLAFLPWVLWTARVGSDSSALPLLIALILGALGRGMAQRSRRWWSAVGLAAGVLLLQPLTPWLMAALALWLLAAALLAWWTSERTVADLVEQGGVLLAATLTVALPYRLPELGALSLGLAPDEGQLLLIGLLQSGGAELELFRNGPLLPPWLAGTAWAGLVGLLWARPRTVTWLPWLCWLPLGAAILLGGATTDAATAWLVWLVPLTLAAAWSVDTLLTPFLRLWTPLISPGRALVASTVAAALLLLPATLDLTRQIARPGGIAAGATGIAMTQYLSRCLTTRPGPAALPDDDPCRRQGDQASRFIVPPDVLTHPTTRLLLSQGDAAGRIFALDAARDLLPPELPPGDLIFLVGLDNQPLIDLLTYLHPNAELRTPLLADLEGGTPFITVRLARPDLAAQRGLLGDYFAGHAAVEGVMPFLTRRDGATAFAWADDAPATEPFHAAWEGTLLVPRGGAYRFALAGDLPTGADAPLISLTVDERVVLDSALGLVERRETLAQGPARFVLRYRSAAPLDNGSLGNWAVHWAESDAPLQPIPAQALISPPVPDVGLLGAYLPADGQGATLALRKDLLPGADPGLDRPYSVRWQGTLTTPRAGESIFAVMANGPLTLALDGRVVLEHLPPASPGMGPAYSQGSIYLTGGRHALDVRYTPGGPSDLRLIWQAPGSAPALLLSRYLSPLPPDAAALHTPWPAPPPLLDPRLGDDSFALTVALEMDQPARSLPPENLPFLVAEEVWSSAEGCGEAPARLNSPRGLAIDDAGRRLYVADAQNRRIAVLDMETGALLTSYTLEAFEEPVDVALEHTGSLLVLDALAQTVFRLDPTTGEGAAPAIGTGFYRPRGLAVDTTGNIGIADTGGARVVLLDTAGVPFAQFGGQGTVLGSGQPVDVVTVNGEWWAVSAENGRLWRLNGMGSLPAIPRTNTLTGPHLAALPDGAFFLSDPARRSVLYFAPNGRPLAQLGYADAFLNPTGVAAAGRDGLVYLAVADSALCRITLWRLHPA